MVSLEVKVAEVMLELAGTLVLDIGVTNGVLESVRNPLNFDVGETDIIVAFLEVFETGGTLVGRAPEFMHVLGESDVLMDMILEALTGSSLLEIVIRLFPVPETSDPCVVVLREKSEAVEVCDVLLVDVEELEGLAEAEVAELVVVRSNVDSLKQDMSLGTS